MADPQFSMNPPAGVVPITPSDTTVLQSVQGCYVGGTGDVAVVMADGSTGTYKAVPTGTQLVGKFSKIMLTGTTATNLLAQRS